MHTLGGEGEKVLPFASWAMDILPAADPIWAKGGMSLDG